MFMQREFVSEIRHYQAKQKDLELDDLLRRISGMRPIHKKEIREIEERIDKLCWACQDCM
jgi:hypothetical protein